MKSTDVWIFPEYECEDLSPRTLGLIAEAQNVAEKLNRQLGACLIGYGVEKYIDTLSNYGTKIVYMVDNELLSDYSLDAYTFVINKLVQKYSPSILMFEASPIGNELASRVAARTQLNCITNVNNIKINKDNFLITKSGYNDKVYINYEFVSHQSIIVTILSENFVGEKPDNFKDCEIIKEDIRIRPDMIRTRNLNFIKGDPSKISLEEADKIIAVGNGINSKELPLVEELAGLLGASIGATRPVVDRGIIPSERQIGITGKTVNPSLFIACAISGAREFTAGIEQSKLSIAINSDKNARIFQNSDIGLVADVVEIFKSLLTKLEEKASK